MNVGWYVCMSIRLEFVKMNTIVSRKHSLQRTIVAAFVVFSVFITNIVIFGFTAVLPIYLVEFKEVFRKSHDLVLLVIFLPSGVFGIVGFITGMFLTKFGIRTTGIIGSLFLAISIGAPSFSSSIYVLLGCFSILPGFGCSFLNISANTGLATYFGDDSRKFIAFTTIGKALGYIIFPIVANYFIEIMFWRGSLLLLAATFIHTLPCVFMYSTDMYKNTETEHLTDNGSSDQKDLNKSPSKDHEELFQNGSYIDDETTSNQLEISKERNTTWNQKGKNNTNVTHSCDAVNEAFTIDEDSYAISNTQQSKIHSSNSQEKNINSTKSDNDEIDAQNSKVIDAQNSKTIKISDLKCSAKLISVLTNLEYVLFLFSLFIVYGCVITSSSILPDYCVKQGLSRAESARVFSVGSLGYALACFVSSWLIHKNMIPSKIMFCLASIISGISICVYPSLSSAAYLTLLTCVIMFTTGIAFSVYFVSIMDFFDIGLFSIAVGFAETAVGLGILSGGYLIGLFSEYMDTYEYSYYVIGVGPILSVQPVLITFLVNKLLNKNYSVNNVNNKS